MLKKSPLTLIFLLLSVLLVSACSRNSIYETAMGMERSMAGLEADSVTVGELDIAYLRNTTANNGDTLVLIHGFSANKDNWTRIARKFTDDFNVYAIDLPGHGESSKPLDIGYTFDQQVDHVARILKALDIQEMHMMGNSMGGGITALYAATYPEQIKTAVLFDPAGIMDFDNGLVDMVLDGDNPLIPSKPGDLDRLLDFAMEDRPFIPWPVKGVLEEKAIANQNVAKVIFADIRDAGFQPDFRNAMSRVEDPVLVIWGKEDRLLDYRNGESFKEAISGAQLEIMEGIGHMPMLEAPKKSASLFLEFAKDHLSKAN